MRVIDALKKTLINKKAEIIIAVATATLFGSGIIYYIVPPGGQILIGLLAKATIAYVLSYFASLIGFGEVDWSDDKWTPKKVGHLVMLIATALIFAGTIL